MTDNEAPRVFEASGGLCVSYRGRLLYSARDPAALPRRVAAACDRGPSRLHLVPSPLLWYGVRELLSAIGPGSAVLCVEADPELERIARRAMPPELAADDRIAFAAVSTIEDAIEASRRLGVFRTCSLIALSGGESLNAPLYRAMAAALSAEFESSWRNRAALMILGDRWAKNIFDNIAALAETNPERLPRFAVPAVVCGAGASLETAIPLLSRSKARGRISVIACDTALGTLLAAGIEPDLTVCLESQAHNLSDFTCLGSRSIRLAVDISSHPATFRAVRGPKHLTAVRITHSPFLSRTAAFLSSAGVAAVVAPPLGSVGVHACYLAAQICAGPIFAVGLDFSFAAGKTHARGCPSILSEQLTQTRLTRWTSQYAASFRDRTIKLTGGTVSDPILLSYARVLENLAAGVRGPGGSPRFFDIRGRGPAIGAQPIPLAEAESIINAQYSWADTDGSPPDNDRAGVQDSDRGGKQRAVRAFLDAELGKLERLRDSMRGSKQLGRDDFRALLLDLDYLWWNFPDQDRISNLPQDLLNRLVPRVEYYLARISALLRAQ